MRSICEDESGRVRCVSFPPLLMDADGSIVPSVTTVEEESLISHRSPQGNRHSPLRVSVPPVGEALGTNGREGEGTEEEGEEEEYERDKEAEERRGTKRGERC